MEDYYYDKYFKTYTKLYNLSVEHDNLMGVSVNWRFLNEVFEEYIDHAKDRKEMTDQQEQGFRQGWARFLDRMFD